MNRNNPAPDPDHGPMGNQEAELNREIAFLKEKLAVAQGAQDTIWKANIELAKQAREDADKIAALLNSHSLLAESHARMVEALGKLLRADEMPPSGEQALLAVEAMSEARAALSKAKELKP